MRCSLRRLTCAVSILLLISSAFAGVLNGKVLKRIAEDKLREKFGDRVKLADVRFYLKGTLSYREIDRVVLSVREGNPRGSLHLYLLTDRGLRRVTANLKLLWLCELPTAAEHIGRGERIYPHMVEIRREYRERCPQHGIRAGELINYTAIREIRTGEPIRISYLRKIPLVRRGDEVEILFRRGNIEIRLYGEAMDTGFYGDVIRVKVSGGDRVLRGRVVSEGSVVVR